MDTMKGSKYMTISVMVLLTTLLGCGQIMDGDYTGTVEGKDITLQFLPDGTASVLGYFPNQLVGTWVEEKTFGDPQIWVTFDGPKEKPFRLRFEFKPQGKNFQLTGIKARPLGKGTKLNPVMIKGTPIFKPLAIE
tara:strand:- start:737 stop:1141 length:405 start_codon:yes stop_codon:yes gene_type:complete